MRILMVVLFSLGLVSRALGDDTTFDNPIVDLVAKPVIVTSNHPLGLAAKWVVGERAVVVPVLGANQSPHHAALTARQRLALDTADLIIWLGAESEPAFAGAIAQMRAPVLEFPAGELAGDNDLHRWLSPHLLKSLGEQLEQHLGMVAESGWQERLAQTVTGVERKLAALPRFRYVVQHDALRYFTDAFRLPPAIALRDSHGQAAGAKARQTIEAGARGASCLLVETGGHAHDVEVVAERFRLPMVEVDITGRNLALTETSYDQLLNNLADAFTRCANGSSEGVTATISE